ncbi:odorant receptor 47 [Nasonia vitripennis]|uniref:Odorant receptor n=1 Tax=Nasonia vitripennis TaxID=7425 RepID=A0A7M6UDZ6_NASVI|nr:odorant receptor 47 [Nasonia vitripennis]
MSSWRMGSIKDIMMNVFMMKVIGVALAIWPLKSAGKRWYYAFLQEMVYRFFHVNFWLLVIPSLWSIYKKRHNLASVLTSVTQLTIVFEILAIMVLSRRQAARLKTLLTMAYDYVSVADDKVYPVVYKYVRKAQIIFGIITIAYALILLTYLVQAFIENKPPIYAYYPFDIKSPVVWICVYGNQLLCTFYAAVVIIMDAMMMFMIFVTSIRLELLQNDFKKVKDYPDLVKCIRTHQDIIWYIKEVYCIKKYMVLKMLISIAIYIMCEGLQLFALNLSWGMRFQVSLLFGIGLFRVYIYAACSQDLISSGLDLGYFVYSSLWYNQSHSVMVAKAFVICRCQKSLGIRVCGITDDLNMKFLANFLYRVFSYTMTLRAIIKTLR